MFGTVARMRCKPGGHQWVRAWVDVQTRRGMAGWISTSVYQSESDPSLIWLTVVFESREAYVANANTPVQDQLYHQMLSALEEPPEWSDGELMLHTTAQEMARR
jgi:quinol monooxygenase YgiN